MPEAPAHWVGKVVANVQSRVFPCGHVELVKGNSDSVVEFAEARRFAAELTRQLDEAERLFSR